MSADGNNLGNARDDVLVKHAKDGDQNAFGILFLRYRVEIYICLMRVVRNDGIVEDLLQDTYIKAWRHIESLNEPLRFKSWLIVIAKNLALDWLRQNPPGRTIAWEEDGSVSHPVDEDADPQVVIEKEYFLCVLAKIEPPFLREVLVYTIIGYSPAEIAHLLGCAKGTVITYQSLARRQFRQLYFSLMDGTDETRKEE